MPALGAFVLVLASCGGGSDGSSSAVGGPADAAPDTPPGSESLRYLAVETRIKASHPAYDNRFGNDVALSGDGETAVIGAMGQGSAVTGIDAPLRAESKPAAFVWAPGAVYVFRRRGADGWHQQTYIKPSRVAARFGSALGLTPDGSRLVVGADQADGPRVSDVFGRLQTGVSNGAVFVFDRDASGQWSEQAALLADGARGTDMLGASVAVSADGTTVVAGAPSRDWGEIASRDDYRSEVVSSGAVHVFVLEADGRWRQRQLIRRVPALENDRFGSVLALSADGTILAIAAGRDDRPGEGEKSSGVVLVYQRDQAGAYRYATTLVPLIAPTLSDFGVSIATSSDGASIVVGASYSGYTDPGAIGSIGGVPPETITRIPQGTVTVFERSGRAWPGVQTVTSPVDDRYWSRFGSAVAITPDGRRLVVGMEGADRTTPAQTDVGAAFIFERTGERFTSPQWTQPQRPNETFQFASAVAVSADGHQLLVGAPGDEGSVPGVNPAASNAALAGSGAAFLIELP